MDSQLIILVVPTCGNVVTESGQLEPSATGKQRLKAADRYARHCHQAIKLIIVGGERADPSQSEAEVLKRWGEPWLTPSISEISVIAKSRYSAGDMVALSPWLQDKKATLILLVTHPDHAKFMAKTLRHQGVSTPMESLDSGRKRPTAG